jgi:drug/metabolite transporter (DMT)-like permease
MTALSVPLQGEQVPPRRWIAIACGLGGVMLILRPSSRAFGSVSAVAAAAIGTRSPTGSGRGSRSSG